MKRIVDVKIPYLGELLILAYPRIQRRLDWEYTPNETIIRWSRFEIYLVRGGHNGPANRQVD
jgi:hypothetical protein